MRKLTLIIALSFFLASGCASSVYASISASNSGNNSSVAMSNSSGDVPEVNGEYDDPKDKMVRVRVYAHKRSHLTQTVDVCTDVDSSRSVDDERWRLPSNVTFNLNLSSPVGSLPEIASLSFSSWQNAISNKVNFSRGADTSTNQSSYDGQNIVAFGNTSSRTLGVTYIRYLRSSRQVVDVDTILNQSLAWRWTPYTANLCSPDTSYDVQDILTHELGHWLGLDDEYTSRYKDHTMYGYGSLGEIKKDTLTTGDTNSANSLYP